MDISVYLDQQTSQFMLKTVQQQVHVVNNVKKKIMSSSDLHMYY